MHPSPACPYVTTHEMPALASLRSKMGSRSVALASIPGEIRAAGGHPRLWRRLADEAIDRLDWRVAERALVHLADHADLQWLKRVRGLPDETQQRVEIHARFGRPGAAEEMLARAGRLDLAVELWSRLGHAQRVLELVALGGDADAENADGAAAASPSGPVEDKLLRGVHLRAGDYWADRQAWRRAIPHYVAAGAHEALVECYARAEDFAALSALGDQLGSTQGHLLVEVATRLATVGLADAACALLVRAGDPRAAVACAARLQRWQLARQLAEWHGQTKLLSTLGDEAVAALKGLPSPAASTGGTPSLTATQQIGTLIPTAAHPTSEATESQISEILRMSGSSVLAGTGE